MNAPAAFPRPSTTGPSIEGASADYRQRRTAWLIERRLEMARRHGVRAVDAFLCSVEEINLSGHGRQPDPLIPARVRRLEAQLGRQVPAAVRLARNAHQLHAALLDWQDELLSEAVPQRAARRAADDVEDAELGVVDG
jgi:hypothetical protein